MTDHDRYYPRLNKTFHVQLQLEPIVRKGSSPAGIELNIRLFSADVAVEQHGLLTA
jgi:hypothetical protein